MKLLIIDIITIYFGLFLWIFTRKFYFSSATSAAQYILLHNGIIFIFFRFYLESSWHSLVILCKCKCFAIYLICWL